jgi:hypothetical protein
LLYWPNRKTRAGTITTTKNYIEKHGLTKILCAIQTSSSENPMVRELQQQTGFTDYASVDYTTQAITIHSQKRSSSCIRIEFIFL